MKGQYKWSIQRDLTRKKSHWRTQWLIIMSRIHLSLVLVFWTMAYSQGVIIDQCSKADSYFVKINQELEIEAESWIESILVNTEMQCPSKCHHIPQCKSASFNIDTKVCRLADSNRMSVDVPIQLSSKVVYYERMGCSANQTRFISYIPEARD